MDNDIRLSQLRDAKKKLETDIRLSISGAVEQFRLNTGLYPSDIDIHLIKIHSSPFGLDNVNQHSIISSVDVSVDLF